MFYVEGKGSQFFPQYFNYFFNEFVEEEFATIKKTWHAVLPECHA